MSTTVRRDRAEPRDWLRAATTRRMLALLLVVVVVAAACTRLGLWQLERAGIRGQEAAQAEREELMAAPAVPVADVLDPQAAFGAEQFGRRVSLEGHFVPEQQVLVPGRHVEGQDALMVVTAFHVDGGAHDGAIMPVLRGWLPERGVLADRLEAGTTTAAGVAVPPPPAGRTEIVGVLSDSEAAGDPGLPEGFAGGISAGELAGVWGTPMYSAYLVLEEPVVGGLRPAPSPVEELDSGRNIQSLAYAVEWWAFALFAVVFWLKVLRDDVRERRLSAAS